MNGAGQTERVPAVPARATIGDFVAAAAGRQIRDDLLLYAVNRDIPVNIRIFAKKGFYAPQIAQTLFADIAAENDVADRLDS